MSKLRVLNPWPWIKKYFWKLTLVLLVCLAAYLLFLDAQIQQKFSGNKWQVPAQIYARPMQLHLKQEITNAEIVEELELLGYRRVSQASKTGEYQVSRNQFTIMRRAFHFAEGYEGPKAISLQLEGGRLVDIRDIERGQLLERTQLEPWLVTRLLSSGREDRMLLSMEDVPEALLQALILIEDKDFYSHFGVAPLSIVRALMANISAGKTVQGGSTLTQQLVKNLFLSREKSLVRKAKEALMALLIEVRYSKEEIIEAYLNEVFLGQNGATGVYGFGLASYFYFDRPLNELDLNEIATLVGIIKGPSYYNPRRYPERVMQRRNLVLRVLFDNNFLDRIQFETLLNSPILTASGASLAKGKHPAFMDKVSRELRSVLADPDIRQSGLKVFTTMDINAQRKAEAALVAQVEGLEKSREINDLQAAMVVTDIASGEIRAIVGGKDVDYQGFNRALDASRSVGSLIKPAIYLTALEQSASYNLASPLKDEPIKLKSTYGKLWEPQNSDKQFRGQVPLITALTRSLNVPTVSLGMELGLSSIIESLRKLGVQGSIQSYPALTLGALDLSPLEVNQMYQTMSNNGAYIPLHAVTGILSPDNQLLWRFQRDAEQRFDEKASYLLNYALHKVTLEGTAKVIKRRFPTINMAGKTGTTDDYRDSWFSGFDKNILVTGWMGTDDNLSTGLTGTSGALQLYLDYQKRQQPKSLVRRFPQGLGIAHFDMEDGHITQAGCKNSMSVPAILDALPLDVRRCVRESQPIVQPKKRKAFGREFLVSKKFIGKFSPMGMI